MSASIRTKSARARATIAIRMLKTQKCLYRAFDDCFEMYDGDEVVREIRRRSLHDSVLVQALIKHQRDSWLTPDYFSDEKPPPTQQVLSLP
jgi:hypothetical protein